MNEISATLRGSKAFGFAAASKAVSFVVLATSIFIVSCSRSSYDAALDHPENVVVAVSPALDTTIGDTATRFSVLGKTAAGHRESVLSTEGRAFLREHATSSSLEVPAPSQPAAATPANSLVLGFPVGLLGQQYVFGGVVTKVSDKKSEDLGNLKLTDLTAVHVTAEVVPTANDGYAFVLIGCTSKCTEASDQQVLLGVPVVGVDVAAQKVLVDLAPLGSELNLIAMLDPTGSELKLKTKSSAVTSFDYSLSTLVFDVEVKMEPLVAQTPPAAETAITVRWYLRLASAFNPAFVARDAADGVGFFMTERGATAKIERQTLPVAIGGGLGQTTVKYYVKDVPKEYQPAFAAAFDEWNEEFKKLLGKSLLSYEFLDSTDPRYARLVPGDARFHILEWDLVNSASYGGLGPSMANQFTGEIFSSNVLIQGPHIVDLYTKWFGVSRQAEALRAEGREREAREVIHAGFRELAQATSEKGRLTFKMDLGNRLVFRIPSQEPSFHDPLFQRDDFELTPAGFDYKKYMFGYFREMVAHELGHNLGLRHNFRGNLASDDSDTEGKVSNSIMEYLGRRYRYNNLIGDYDRMAIAYGYAGQTPAVKNLYCTDENAARKATPENSAECSSDDAGSNPFSYLEAQLDRAIGLLTLGSAADAPVWTVADMDKELGVAIGGLGFYASSAEKTGKQWTNFFVGNGRPTAVDQVKPYVLTRLKAQLCGPALDAAVAAKAGDEAKKKTTENIAALRKKASDILTANKAFSSADLVCSL